MIEALGKLNISSAVFQYCFKGWHVMNTHICQIYSQIINVTFCTCGRKYVRLSHRIKKSLLHRSKNVFFSQNVSVNNYSRENKMRLMINAAGELWKSTWSIPATGSNKQNKELTVAQGLTFRKAKSPQGQVDSYRSKQNKFMKNRSRLQTLTHYLYVYL